MEYSLDFARELANLASSMKGSGHIIEERKRAMLYLSLLSIEIALKHLLEKAGVPVKSIRNQSHNIESLLKNLSECEIEALAGTQTSYVSASRIRSRIVNPAFGGATVGNLLEGESKGASRYPGEIRYGEMPKHYPPDLMVECAQAVINWAENEGRTIRMTGSA